MTTKTNSARQTQALATKFAEKIKGGGVVCLFGDLGAGKTTFSQAVAKALGVKERVVSPTFILVRRYELPAISSQRPATRFFWHVDLYRLNTPEEVTVLGLEEIMTDPENVVLIEWPEKIIDRLPKKRWEVKFTEVEKNVREVIIEEK